MWLMVSMRRRRYGLAGGRLWRCRLLVICRWVGNGSLRRADISNISSRVNSINVRFASKITRKTQPSPPYSATTHSTPLAFQTGWKPPTTVQCAARISERIKNSKACQVTPRHKRKSQLISTHISALWMWISIRMTTQVAIWTRIILMKTNLIMILGLTLMTIEW